LKTDAFEESVFSKIKGEDVIKLTQELIRIPGHRSCDGQEKHVAEFIASTLETIGIEVSLQRVVDDRFNVIARIPGEANGPSLMLTGHTDTVPAGHMEIEPFDGAIQDNKIYGRGASDMKGSLAAMICAMQAIKESNVDLKGDLVFVGAIGEETTSEGTAYLVRNGPKTDFAINGEPTNMEVAIAHKGSVLIQVTTIGKAAHCDTPWLGINAIEKTSKIVQAIADRVPNELKQKTHKYTGPPTINIAFVSGGEWPYTTVPDESKIVIITGLLPGESKEAIPLIYEGIIKELKTQDPNLRAKVDIVPIETIPEGYNLSFETPESSPIVKSVEQCATRVLGTRPRLVGVPYWCDASILSHAGVQTVIFGPGNIDVAHSSVEYVPVNHLIDASRVYALAALDLCQHQK
jgi:acetylornithine deacetylase/succinyl-diaminopimelate desuccinylase family protein